MTLTPEQIVIGVRVAALIIVGVWLLLILDRNRWWPSLWSLHLDAAAREPQPGEYGELVVVVPARNEAATLPRTLPRLLKQVAWMRRLVVVDDRSEDQTRSATRRLADGTDGERKLEIVSVDDHPEDWNDKSYAMHVGYEAAVKGWAGDTTRQWILFTDADILHPAHALGGLLSKAGRDEHDLLSVMVKLRARSAWEWLLIPAYVYFLQMLYPFRKVSDPKRRRGAAVSGVMLVRRSALDEVGGLECARAHAVPEFAIAQAIKAGGGSCWLGLDPDTVSVRTYDSFTAIAQKAIRTSFGLLGYRYWLVPVVVSALLALFVAPIGLTVYGAYRLDAIIGVAGAISWLFALANLLPVVQYLGVPSGMVLSLPLSATLYAGIAVASAWRRLTGRSTSWRVTAERRLPDA